MEVRKTDFEWLLIKQKMILIWSRGTIDYKSTSLAYKVVLH